MFVSWSWLVVVYGSETLLCTGMFVNSELGKVGHKMDGSLDAKWTERDGEGWTQNGRNELGKVGHKMDGTSWGRLDTKWTERALCGTYGWMWR